MIIKFLKKLIIKGHVVFSFIASIIFGVVFYVLESYELVSSLIFSGTVFFMMVLISYITSVVEDIRDNTLDKVD